MASKKTSLKPVLNKFPEQVLLIKELFEESDSFRSLCEDYAECSEVIKRLDCSKLMIQKGYKEEYKALLHDLEEELIAKLIEKKNIQEPERNKSP